MDKKNNFSYKKYNIFLLTIIGFLIVCIGLLNYIVNPFNIFKQRLLPQTFLKADAKIQERLTKPIGFKIDKRKINTIFIGSSRVDLCIDKNDYKSLTGKEAENLAVGAVTPAEIIQITELARKIHPEIENIYIGFDFEFFQVLKNFDDNRAAITNNKKLEISEINSALFSIKATGTSFWTIFKNIFHQKKRTYYSSGVKCIFLNKNIKQEFQNTVYEYDLKYELYNFDKNQFDTFIKYLKQLQKDNINVKIFIMPTHITLQKMLYKHNLTGKYNYIRSLLVQDFDIYDFNYPNKYTQEKITPDMIYFFDGSHATHNLSKIIISDILTEKPVLARKITKNNIEEMNNLFIQEINGENDYAF